GISTRLVICTTPGPVDLVMLSVVALRTPDANLSIAQVVGDINPPGARFVADPEGVAIAAQQLDPVLPVALVGEVLAPQGNAHRVVQVPLDTAVEKPLGGGVAAFQTGGREGDVLVQPGVIEAQGQLAGGHRHAVYRPGAPRIFRGGDKGLATAIHRVALKIEVLELVILRVGPAGRGAQIPAFVHHRLKLGLHTPYLPLRGVGHEGGDTAHRHDGRALNILVNRVEQGDI